MSSDAPHPARMPPAKEWPALTPRPDSITWQRASDVRVLLAAGYALVLQVSHPAVGAGVSEHSRFREDPWGRLLRTLDYTYTMVYGGPRAAGEMGRRIRSFHSRIRGTLPDGRPYHALEAEPYAWVHATLAEAIVRGHERFGRPFAPPDRERFWREWRTMGRLLGIAEAELPCDWRGFRDHFHAVVDHTLELTPAAEEVLESLARPAPPDALGPWTAAWTPARLPLGHLLALATIGLLPAGLRKRLDVRWTSVRELELRALGGVLRAGTPVMPSRLRNTGTSYLGWRAEAIARGDVASPARLASSTA